MKLEEDVEEETDKPIKFTQVPFSAHQGGSYTSDDIQDTLIDWASFVTVKEHGKNFFSMVNLVKL
jgi:hypothetical protein